MSDQITTAFVQQYAEGIELTAQQKGSKTIGYYREESIKGESEFFDQVGATAATELASRHQDTPRTDTPHTRRRVTTTYWVVSDLIDKRDMVRTLNDPTNAYVQAFGYALGRARDAVLVDAVRGTAYTGKTGATSVPLPSAQKVAVGSTGLTLAKLLTMKEILDGNDINPEGRAIGVSAQQVTNLLNTTEIKSADYNTVKALAAGEVDTFLQFKFIPLNGLRGDGTKIIPKVSTTRFLPVWQRDCVLMATGMNQMFKIDQLPTKNYSTQVYAAMDIGGTRMQEIGCGEIGCLET